MAKTISPGGPVYREFASNTYGEILANFDADDSLAYVLIYKNQTPVDTKKHAGTTWQQEGCPAACSRSRYCRADQEPPQASAPPGV